jgi:hypothetical protein
VNQDEFLVRIARILNDCAIPYMLVGSFASSLHGTPRATADIDMVIDPTPTQLELFLQRLPEEDYYVSADAARDALRLRRQFNVIGIASGWKLDLIVPETRVFSRSELDRRSTRVVRDYEVDVASPEDTIIAKLEWSKAGGSERQLEDVAGILRLQRDALDSSYIERWVQVLELEPQWERAQALVPPAR